MEKSYINNILNFADENINTAQNLIITKEEAKEIIKELNKNYIPKKIVKIKMEELNNDIKNVYEKYKTKISYSGLEQIWYGYRWKEVL